MDKAYFQLMARYHRWAYERLYNEVDRLPKGQYFQSRRLFFDSIHGTLNHILLAERIWHGRFTGIPYEFDGLDDEIVEAPTALRDALFEQCDVWDAYVAVLDEAALESDISYRNTQGKEFSFPLKFLLGHVFNHATHHRGQVSAAITQSGLPAPAMDLPYFLIEEAG